MAAVSVAGVLSLAACGGGSDPLKSPAPKPSSEQTAGRAVPVLTPPPSAAFQHTDDGALAFVRAYFETLLNDAYRAGQVQELAIFSDPNCVVCRATIGDIAYFAATGTRAEGGTVSVSALKVAGSSPDLTTITLAYSAAKLSEINLDGSTAYSTPGTQNQSIYVQVQYDSQNKRWVMRQIINKPLQSPTASPSASATASP